MTPQVFVLSWHPENYSAIASGGYTRLIEILKRSQTKVSIIDTFPSIYQDLVGQNVDILEYHTESLLALKRLHPVIYKIFDRLLTSFLILKLLIAQKTHNAVIYIPFSELVELSVPAVIFKFFVPTQLVFCNLNVNTYPFDALINRLTHQFADRIITISQSLKQDLHSVGIHVTHLNGVGFDMPVSPKKAVRPLYDAIYIGRHIPQKGIVDLIDIWTILVNQLNKPFKLVTIGDTPSYMSNDLTSRIAHSGLTDSITMLGKVSDIKKNSLLRQSRLFVFPSHQEGWGIAPMEALSAGLPVVAYTLPVYQESIGQTSAFRQVKLGDTAEFAKAVADTLADYSHYHAAALSWKPRLNWTDVASEEWRIILEK